MSRSISLSIALLMLVICGCDSITSGVNDATHDLGGMFSHANRSPRAAAAKMEDQYFPDERREGINEMVSYDFGKRPPYTTRYEQIAQTDEDWLVRATAIRALNRSRDYDATPIFVKALNDPNDQVRLEACKALIHMPDPAAVPGLVRIVSSTDDNHDVRIAAADALKHYRTVEVARSLANTLDGRDFGVAWQAHQTLIYLTGQDMRYDEAAWLAYLTGPEKPFG